MKQSGPIRAYTALCDLMDLLSVHWDHLPSQVQRGLLAIGLNDVASDVLAWEREQR